MLENIKELVIMYLPVILSSTMTFIIIPLIKAKFRNLTIESDVKNVHNEILSMNSRNDSIVKELSTVNAEFARVKDLYKNTDSENILLKNAIIDITDKIEEISKRLDTVIYDNVKIKALLRGVNNDDLYEEAEEK